MSTVDCLKCLEPNYGASKFCHSCGETIDTTRSVTPITLDLGPDGGPIVEGVLDEEASRWRGLSPRALKEKPQLKDASYIPPAAYAPAKKHPQVVSSPEFKPGDTRQCPSCRLFFKGARCLHCGVDSDESPAVSSSPVSSPPTKSSSPRRVKKSPRTTTSPRHKVPAPQQPSSAVKSEPDSVAVKQQTSPRETNKPPKAGIVKEEKKDGKKKKFRAFSPRKKGDKNDGSKKKEPKVTSPRKKGGFFRKKVCAQCSTKAASRSSRFCDKCGTAFV